MQPELTFFNIGHRVFVRSDQHPAKPIADCDSEITAKMIVNAVELSHEVFTVVRAVEQEMEAASGSLH